VQKRNKTNATWPYAHAVNIYGWQTFCCSSAYSDIQTHIRRVPSRAECYSARLVLNGNNMLGLCDPSNLVLVLSTKERRDALLKLLWGGLVVLQYTYQRQPSRRCWGRHTLRPWNMTHMDSCSPFLVAIVVIQRQLIEPISHSFPLTAYDTASTTNSPKTPAIGLHLRRSADICYIFKLFTLTSPLWWQPWRHTQGCQLALALPCGQQFCGHKSRWSSDKPKLHLAVRH